MPQSLCQVHLHLIFSTKNREPFLDDPLIRSDMHAYLASTLNRMDLPARIVGGTADHVHILYSASRVDTIAESVQAVKQNSSKWVKTKHAALRPFAWQGGYGVFSVSHSNLRRVADYIANQEAHHKKETFQSEYRKFLRRHEVEFDERYVWD